MALLLSFAGGCAPGLVGSSCGSDFDCAGGLYCDTSGVCRRSATTCAASSDCNRIQICVAGVCVEGCRSAGCPSGQSCDRALDQCVTEVIALDGDISAGGAGTSGTGGGATSSGTAVSSGSGYRGSAGASSSGSGTGSQGANGTSGSTGTTARAESASGSTTGSSTTGGAACTGDTWANFAGGFFKTYCSKCHNWTAASVSQDGNVERELQTEDMPPRSSLQPSAQDLARILAWINCGEP